MRFVGGLAWVGVLSIMGEIGALWAGVYRNDSILAGSLGGGWRVGHRPSKYNRQCAWK